MADYCRWSCCRFRHQPLAAIEPELPRRPDKIAQARGPRLAADVEPMRFNRADGEREAPRDLLVGKAAADEAQHFRLAIGEAVEVTPRLTPVAMSAAASPPEI